MKKTGSFIAALLVFSLGVFAQNNDDSLKKQIRFLEQIKGSFEGFQRSTCKNTISYHSLRKDVTDGLITRATDGAMEIDWQTAAVPNYFKNDGAWFVWLAAIDITSKKVNFDVFVDNQKRFTILSGKENAWEITNPEGGILRFQAFDSDQHGDAHGYMTLYAPKSWLKTGRPLQIKIVGEAAGENTWIIVYRADDIISFLKNSIDYQLWLDVSIRTKNKSNTVIVKAPENLAGKKLRYSSGKRHGEFLLEKAGDVSQAEFIVKGDIKTQNFIVSDENGELLYIENFQKDTVIQRLLPNAVLINELYVNNNQFNAKSRRLYKPKTVKSLVALNSSKVSRGNIYLMNSSHQDIAWMDSPEKCVIERDTMLISPLIGQAQINPNYRFDIEDALMIKEYIERHPDKKETIKRLFREGKISCGSSYTQPYEEMYSGEALVRQFYFGRKWLKQEFGYDATTYWNVDVPGRTLQMAQILKKSGSPYMMISRHEKGIFNWFSPDGSFVTTFSPGHYGSAYTPLHQNFYEAAGYLAKSSLEWEKYYAENSAENVIPLLSDWDMSPANDYSALIKQWEEISELVNEKGKKSEIQLPLFNIVTAPEMFGSFIKAANPLPSITGERPALWLYIHGPGHQKALKASREADVFLTMAEKFASAEALVNGSFVNYPTEKLRQAWEAKIYPDHGWGGKNGQITDDLFRRKFEFARYEAKNILENSTRTLASKINTNSQKGIPLVVFNSLSWERTDVVEFQVNFENEGVRSLTIYDENGETIPVQYRVEKKYPDGAIQTAKVYAVAGNIPSIGYKTFYLKTSKNENQLNQNFASENKYFKIEFSDGGLKSIYDKSLQKELIDPTKFVAGEVFTMQSVGNGAGEFEKIQQPTMDGFDQTGNHQGEWKQTDQGEVFSAWVKRTNVKHAVIEQKITLYHAIKKIGFDIALLNWDGAIYREFRMALPLNMKNGKVAYEVPFGVVEVGKDEMEGAAGERYNVAAKDLHPRGIENWIGASDETAGVTLSSSVAVADYIDPTTNPVQSPVLQPVLLASRVSCHGEGNQYLQTGNHYFSFSLSSHRPGWKNGFRFGKQANEKLLVVVNPEKYRNTPLPESQSFFGIEAENLIISTVKKAEDDNGIIVRVYETEGKNTSGVLKSFKTLGSAEMTNLIEEPLQPLKTDETGVPLKIGHHAIETVKLKNYSDDK